MTISELARQIANAFNLTDIKYICADLGIDYEVLPKDNKEDMALELVLKTKRESQLQQLVDLCRNKREHLTWVVPAEQTIPKSASPSGIDVDKPGGTQALTPAVQLVGRWQVACFSDRSYSAMVEFYPNWGMQGQGYSAMTGGAMWTGNYGLNYVANTFHMNMLINGTFPMTMFHTFQQGDNQRFVTMGSDGLGYVFTRIA